MSKFINIFGKLVRADLVTKVEIQDRDDHFVVIIEFTDPEILRSKRLASRMEAEILQAQVLEDLNNAIYSPTDKLTETVEKWITAQRSMVEDMKSMMLKLFDNLGG